MRNYKVILEYDGTKYNGLQKQTTKEKTIYETVEKALLKVCPNKLYELSFAGRTDAGVHAIGQVLNAKVCSSVNFPPNKLAMAVNYYLKGEEISAISSIEVDVNFHARHSSVQRIYKYKILNRSFKSPILQNRVWLVPYKIDLTQLQKIADIFVGTHDFSHFRNKDCSAKSPIKTIDFIIINDIKEENIIEITIGAKSFLYNMVRSIVGAMVDVIRGSTSFEEITRKLENKTNHSFQNHQIAPPYGLYFLEAKY